MAAGVRKPKPPPERSEDVKSWPDLIAFAITRLGCDWPEGGDWKRNSIILSYCGYTKQDLALVVDWCVAAGKHPREPWKVICYYDEWKASSALTLGNDPIQQKLDRLYVAADSELRRRILKVSNKVDKAEALALIREVEGG